MLLPCPRFSWWGGPAAAFCRRRLFARFIENRDDDLFHRIPFRERVSSLLSPVEGEKKPPELSSPAKGKTRANFDDEHELSFFRRGFCRRRRAKRSDVVVLTFTVTFCVIG